MGRDGAGVSYTTDSFTDGPTSDTENEYVWETGVWTHLVLTMENQLFTMYKNRIGGYSDGSNEFWVEPGVMSHEQVWLGRNSLFKNALNFTGTIAYFKVTHNKALRTDEVNSLPTIPCVAGTYGGGYPDCLPCPHGTYSTTSGATSCMACPVDKTSFVEGSISDR